MRDCSNGEIRDLLPDLVHERLDADARSQVGAHVSGCEDCTAELALLQRIRASGEGRRMARVDVDRIVGALPRAGRGQHHWTRSTGLRIAAGLAVLIVGASWIRQTRDREVIPVEGPAVAASTPAVQGRDTTRSVASTPRTTPARTTVPTAARVSLDDGLGDLSDGELQSLLAALESFEAVTAVEPSAFEPILESERLR